MRADREQVRPVTGREHVDARLDRAGEDRIVCRFARDRVGVLRQTRSLRCQPGQQLASCTRLLLAEAELLGQHVLELVEDEVRQDKLDPVVDRLLEQAARRPVGDQRRDEDVRVAEDAELQPCLPRSSSTSTSVSSGPTPRSSARRRP